MCAVRKDCKASEMLYEQDSLTVGLSHHCLEYPTSPHY